MVPVKARKAPHEALCALSFTVPMSLLYHSFATASRVQTAVPFSATARAKSGNACGAPLSAPQNQPLSLKTRVLPSA